jgi:hypothetical protein
MMVGQSLTLQRSQAHPRLGHGLGYRATYTPEVGASAIPAV